MIPCLDDWSTYFFYVAYGLRRYTHVELVDDPKEERGYRAVRHWKSMLVSIGQQHEEK